jgi:hypothetical protein
MNSIIKLISSSILFIVISMNSTNVIAQNPVCAYCGTQLPNGIHRPGCPYYRASTSSTKSSSGSSADLSNMVAGAIFQKVIKSMFSNNPANDKKALDAKQKEAELASQQAAEQQKIKEAIAQAEYEKMMKAYKLLEDSQDLKIKTLDNTNLEFKTLDGDAESLSTNARKHFENGMKIPSSGSSVTENATPFFGDTMPIEYLQTLLNPENNPNVVDLRNATKYVDENIKNDSLGIVTLLRKYESESKGSPVIQKPDCIKLGDKLKAFIIQRNQFQKTINLSQNELDIWETANRNALINAAKDGLEYFTGQLLEKIVNRGQAADRLQLIYNKNVNQMTSNGIDVTELKAKIDKLRKMSSAGQISELANNINDWQSFIKDGMSSLISRLTDSNNEINDLLEDPKLKTYFDTDKPELKTLLDISKIAASNMVFGKWVAKKVPMIALVDISIKQLYNGFDYLNSYNRINEAQKINGQVMNAAFNIQKNINDTYIALKECQ